MIIFNASSYIESYCEPYQSWSWNALYTSRIKPCNIYFHYFEFCWGKKKINESTKRGQVIAWGKSWNIQNAKLYLTHDCAML